MPEDQNKLPVEFSNLFNIFEGKGIGAATNLSDDILLLFSTDGTDFAWFEDGTIKRTGKVSEEDGLFDGLAFSTVGAAIDYDEERLIFFNKVGGTYQWVDINPDLIPAGSGIDSIFDFSDETFQLWEWGPDNTCPFDEVGAMFGFSKEPQGCTNVGDDDEFMWMVSDDGNELVRYIKNPAAFESAVELEQWRSESICGGLSAIYPLNGIGAACVFDPDGGIYRELFFSKDGLTMTIFTPSQNKFSEVYNLK